MIFCFSGTGNSRYIAQRIAEALQKTVIDLNAGMDGENKMDRCEAYLVCDGLWQ